nr:DNA repair protein RecO [Deltaproteobacteria bacterium]
MSAIFKSPAFVLSGQDLGESDRLITFYTMLRGKMRGIAKGAKRSRRRFVNALEPFTMLDLSLALPRTTGLNRINSTEIIDNFPFIRHKVECFIMASLCCELVSLWTKENDTQEDIFKLLQWYLKSLNGGLHPRKTTLFFKTFLLALAGYAPDFDRCLLCRRPPMSDHVIFKLHAGGFICSECRKSVEKTHKISLGTLKSLRYIQNGSLDNFHRLNMTGSVFEEAWSLMKGLHCHHLERVPTSYEAFKGLKLEIGK